MASIDSQVLELQKLALEHNLEVVEILSESKSAKAPGRPVFNILINSIKTGKADGILCWKLNRLARNPVDGGEISWLLQQGILSHVQTFGRGYHSSDNVIMMAVELGMANQFIRDLSVDTKRGLRAKAERGWYPTYSTLGYMYNPFKHKGEKEIIEDPERFSLVRKMFDLMLTGAYTPPKILEIATHELGLRTKAGKKLARSSIYRIFSDPFYYGTYEYPKESGNWYQGKHTPMISENEYTRIQDLLGNRPSSSSKSQDFAFRGPIVCGECGALITAEKKVKKQKNGVVRYYTYYHCTKRKDPNCTQKSVEEKELESQITKVLSSIVIPAEFHKWAMDVLREQNVVEAKSRTTVLTSQRRSYDAVCQKIDNLIDLRAGGEITSDEFLDRKASLTKEKVSLESVLSGGQQRIDEWLDTADKYFSFAETACQVFSTGTLSTKKEILAALGSNLTLKDRKLVVVLPKPLELMQQASSEVQKIHKWLEPTENASEVDTSQGVSAVPSIDCVVGDSGNSNQVRTSKNRSVKARPEDLYPTSRSLLRG